MHIYLVKRFLQSLFVLFVMSFVIYGLIGLMPGDPIDIMISSNPEFSIKDAAYLRDLYGLEKPIFDRYLNWLSNALVGDFGYSRLFSKPVFLAIGPALKNTVILMGLSFFLALVLAVPAGILAAMRPYSKIDYSINFFAFAGISVPPFWLALLLIIVFSVFLGILPAGGVGAIKGAGSLWDNFSYIVLPVCCLTFASVGSHIRYIRASMIETLRQDFIRTARAKGLSKIDCVISHALRSSMIPVVTVISLDFGYLFSGALITETVFSFPGMGKLIFDSIMGNDFNLALVSLLFATLLTLTGSFIADIAYTVIDPRVSYENRKV